MKALLPVAIVSACLMGGCLPSGFMSPKELNRGLVIILPGIDGPGLNSAGVTGGLRKGGAKMAIMTHAWGWPVPGVGMVLNQIDSNGARAAGSRVAQMIVDYRREHPGKPVYVIGHSGGGAVAVFTAEAMPAGQKIDGIILIAASISAGYNLSRASRGVSSGIMNYYSYQDGILPNTATISVTVDGVKGDSAGLTGFRRPTGRVYQVAWTGSMQRYGNYGGHMDGCNSSFVAQYIAPWVLTRSWPAR